jgi:transcription initiation factor TFIID subunit 5
MTGHNASIYSLAFSAESSLLVSGGADYTVRCWDVKSAGGLKGKPRENGTAGPANNEGAAQSSYGETELTETCVSSIVFLRVQMLMTYLRTDLVATFPTKRTPITNVQFTARNLCIVSGVYHAPETR